MKEKNIIYLINMPLFELRLKLKKKHFFDSITFKLLFDFTGSCEGVMVLHNVENDLPGW